MSQDGIKIDPVLTDKDPFTIALERSFGSTEEKEQENNPKETSILSINLDEKSDSWHDDNQLDIEDFTGHVNNKNRADSRNLSSAKPEKRLILCAKNGTMREKNSLRQRLKPLPTSLWFLLSVIGQMKLLKKDRPIYFFVFIFGAFFCRFRLKI